MIAMPHRCAQCGGSLKQGFVRDLREHRSETAYWIEGPVERSFLFGVRVRGRRKAAITALRCDACGRLELYAPSPESP
jgi:hypothetical protein